MRLLPLTILLAACGAGPSTPAPGPTLLELLDARGGAYRSVCAVGEQVFATRAHFVERWLLAADGPRLEGEQPAGVPCAPQSLTQRPMTFTAGEQVYTFSTLGLEARGMAWRPAAGGLRAATFDGTYVWAVGPAGLWRWRPGPGRPQAISLEGLVSGQLVDVFRDGPYLWVRDVGGQGYPLAVRGAAPALAAEPGPLPPEVKGWRVPFAGGVIEGQPGATHLSWRSQEATATFALAEDEAAHALLPLEGALLVGGARSLQRYLPGPEGSMTLQASLPLGDGGPTVGLFAVDAETVVVVGASFGLLRIRLTPTSGSPRSPRPAR